MQRTIPLLAINLLPVACVALFGWSALLLLLIYWAENVIVGVFTFFKMLIAGINKGPWQILPTLFYTGFFCFHYGMFNLVHGVLIWGIASDNRLATSKGFFSSLATDPLFGNAVVLTNLTLIIAFQLYLFIAYWLLPGRWRHEYPNEIMATPYGRTVVVHLTILFGGYVTFALGDPLYMVITLALLKTAMELGARIVSNSLENVVAPQSA